MVQISSASAMNSEQFLAAVWNAVDKLYGEYGSSKVGLGLIEFDGEKKHAVLRVLNSAVDTLRAALASITRISDVSVSIHVLGASGTIRALHKKQNVKR